MKFGKRIRTELSAGQLRGSVNYKALKQIAKKVRRAGAGAAVAAASGGGGGVDLQAAGGLAQQQQQQEEGGIEEFFARLELEKEKVADFYRSREAWCFLALESTRGALFGLTRRASKDRLCLAAREGPAAAVGDDGGGQQHLAAQAQDAAGELEGKFLEAKAGATVLISESRDLVQFVDMNMHGFRKVLKKFDKWTSGVRGREYFTSLVQTQPWINGDRAHGILRMVSAMSDHLRSLRPALALGPAAGGPCWADRIVYSVGTFDRPRLSAGGVETVGVDVDVDGGGSMTMMSITPPGSAASSPSGRGGGFGFGEGYGNGGGGGGGGGGAGSVEAAAAKEAVDGPSPLRFLREFGAVVVVGVYTDAAHAASNRAGNGGNNIIIGGGGGGQVGGGGPRAHPAECLEARCARVRPHADRVVVVDSSDPARVREILFGAAAGAVGMGAPTNNCCFVVSDWGSRGPGGSGAGRRARRDVRALMEASMPVFRLPSPTWECAVTNSDGEEEEEEEEGAGGRRGARVAA
ncbi:unnamed protein product [Scytosiphon promiscuus]